MLYLSLFNILIFLRFMLQRMAAERLIAYYVLILLLFLFSAFRLEVGCDWPGYLAQYQSLANMSLEDVLASRDPLWWGLMELYYRAGLPYPWLNVFSSLLFFVGVHVLARRQPDPLGFLILLFPILIVNISMSALRQAAAVGLMCIAFSAFLDRRLILFLLWTFLASGFHGSAAVFFLLAPLVWGSYTKRRLALAGVLAIPGAFLLATGSDAELAFARYVDTGIDAFGAAYRAGLLLLTGLFFMFFLRHRWRMTYPSDFKLVTIGSLMMLAVFPPVFIFSVIADRLGYYLIPIQAMIFARIPYLRGGQMGRFLAAVPYLGLALVFGIWTTVSWHFQECYLPYQTWLFGYPTSAYFLY